MTVTALADRYYAFTLELKPEVAYFSGIDPPHHDGMEDNSPAAMEFCGHKEVYRCPNANTGA